MSSLAVLGSTSLWRSGPFLRFWIRPFLIVEV
jgi:hypothetical protein